MSSATDLIALCERRLNSEDGEGAVSAAKDALVKFRSGGDEAGAANALRYTALAHCLSQQFDEATTLALEQLGEFENAGDSHGAAVMKLAMAEIAGERKGEDIMQKGIERAKAALEVFRDEDDQRMEAYALLALVNLHLEKKGEAPKKAEEAKQLCNDAILIFRDLNDLKGEGLALHGLACARQLAGSVDAALRAHKEALSQFQKANLAKLEAYELSFMAAAHLGQGDNDEAVATAEEALDIYMGDDKAGNKEIDVMQTLVKGLLEKQDTATALQIARDELERFEEAGNKRGMAVANEMSMLVYYNQNPPNHKRAVRFAEQAVSILQEAEDDVGQGRMLRTISRLHREAGDYDKSLRAVQDALKHFEEVEDLQEQGITLQVRTEVYMQKQEHERALRSAAEARELFQDEKLVAKEVEALVQFSRAHFESEDLRKAMSAAKEAQDLASDAGDLEGEMHALRVITDVHMRNEEFEQAFKAAAKTLAMEKELGDRQGEVCSMAMMAQTQTLQVMEKENAGTGTEKQFKDGMEKASKMAKDALAAAKKFGDPLYTGSATYGFAQVQMMQGKFPEALKTAEEAVKLFQEVSYMRGEAATLILMAELHMTGKEIPKARAAAEEAIWLFQEVADAKGEDDAWTELERIDKYDSEQRALQQQQWQQQQMMQQQQFQGAAAGGAEDEQQASAAAPGMEQKLVKMDLGAGLTPDVLNQQIAEVAKGLIGFDEEIEIDMPLMESGLTSNTAVLLRDALTQQLPGISLPVTLVFDYPSISAMTDLIIENAEKAAKKKALKK